MDAIRTGANNLHRANQLPLETDRKSFFQKAFEIIANLWFWCFTKGPTMPSVQATPPPSTTLNKTEELLKKALKNSPKDYINYNQLLKQKIEGTLVVENVEEEIYFDFEEEDNNQEKTDYEGNILPSAFYCPQSAIPSPIENQDSGTESPPPTPTAERSVTPTPEIIPNLPALPEHLQVFHTMLAVTFADAKDSEGNFIGGEELAQSFINILHLEKAQTCVQTEAKGNNIKYTFDYGTPQEASVHLGPFFGETAVSLGPKVAITLDMNKQLITFDPEGAPKKAGLSLYSIQLLPQEKGKSSRFDISTDSWVVNKSLGQRRAVSVNTIVQCGTPNFVKLKTT